MLCKTLATSVQNWTRPFFYAKTRQKLHCRTVAPDCCVIHCYWGVYLFNMPRPLTDTQNDTVAAMLAAGRPQKEIAEAVGCHIGQVKRIKHNLHNWSTPKRPKFRSQGRPRSLTAAHVEVCVLVFFFCEVLTQSRDCTNFLKKNPLHIVRRCKPSSMMNTTL